MAGSDVRVEDRNCACGATWYVRNPFQEPYLTTICSAWYIGNLYISSSLYAVGSVPYAVQIGWYIDTTTHWLPLFIKFLPLVSVLLIVSVITAALTSYCSLRGTSDSGPPTPYLQFSPDISLYWQYQEGPSETSQNSPEQLKHIHTIFMRHSLHVIDWISSMRMSNNDRSPSCEFGLLILVAASFQDLRAHGVSPCFTDTRPAWSRQSCLRYCPTPMPWIRRFYPGRAFKKHYPPLEK